MSRTFLALVFIIALFTVAGALGMYVAAFGSIPPNREVWGQFGDYFGGLLNPLFALAAFLSALTAINIQQKEARAAAEQLREQTEVARKEFEAARADRVGEELLLVVREIDTRLARLLETDVSAPGTYPQVTISLLAAEAERLATVGGVSPSFQQFVKIARDPGSIVEAQVREIRYLVLKLRDFLEHYSKLKSTSYAPVIVYYADKVYQLLHLLEAVGGMPQNTREFFATVSDTHG